MKRILVADPERNVTFTMTKLLQSETCEVLSCNEGQTLLKYVCSGGYDLIVVNSKMEIDGNEDLIPFLQIKQPEASYILIHDEDSNGKLPGIRNVIDQVSKPLDFFTITETINTFFSGSGFSGVISGIHLHDYLQIFCMNKITKAILVTNGGQRGVILVHDGRIVYASQDELRGENAFYEILSWQQGELKEIKIKAFPTPNIDKDVQHLLFCAAQARDEYHPAPPSPADDFPTPASPLTNDLAAEHEQRIQVSPMPLPPASHSHNTMIRTTGFAALLFLMILAGGYFGYQKLFAGKTPIPPKGGTTVAAAAENIKNGNPLTATIEPSAAAPAKAGAKPPTEDNTRLAAPQPAAETTSIIPTEMIFRLHGSNTIGAELGPALVKAFLKDRLHATNIAILPGGKENEVMVTAMSNEKKIAVEIHAHGSSTSFKDLGEGKCDIGMASRKIKQAEVEKLASLGDMTSITSEHVIGLDGIAVIVHKNNTLGKIAMADLSAAFSGQTTSWKDLGNTAGQGINIYARDNKSGTYDTFMNIVMEEKYPLASSAKRYEANPVLSDDVAQDVNAIGFTGLPYVRNAKALAVSDGGSLAIYPTFFTLATEDYPISRRLYMYTPHNSGNSYVSPFIDFVLSEEGQKIVQESGFVDMNIRSFFMDPPARENIVHQATVDKYIEAIHGAQRLSVNFRFKVKEKVLDNRSVRDLDRMVRFLTDKTDKRILLAGFADNSGDYEYNKKLALERAQTAAAELKARGIVVSNIFSCGGELPVASNTTETGREKNRRVEVWVK